MLRFVSVILGMVLWLNTPTGALASYAIQPGDTLRVEVVEDSSLNRVVLVLPDGNISFPGAGTVRAAGQSIEAVRNVLVKRLSAEFAAPPSVYVAVQQLATPTERLAKLSKIYVMGEINTPGLLEVDKGITVLQAIAQAGGFTRFAAKKRVALRRMDPQSQTEQVYIFDFIGNSGISGATLLKEGDVITVPERRLFE